MLIVAKILHANECPVTPHGHGGPLKSKTANSRVVNEIIYTKQ